MYWVIRGTDPATNEDFMMVVEARSAAAAEAWAIKRNVPYITLDEASSDDIAEARSTKRLWSHSNNSRFRCLGRPVAGKQLVCLMLCGVWTILLLLRAGQVPIQF
jgi:hypothetical protein